MKKTIADLFEEFHTEIMAQTARGCPGADFTKANEIYLEFLHTRAAQQGVQRTGGMCAECGRPASEHGKIGVRHVFTPANR